MTLTMVADVDVRLLRRVGDSGRDLFITFPASPTTTTRHRLPLLSFWPSSMATSNTSRITLGSAGKLTNRS